MWSRKLANETNTDTVFIENLDLVANIGADCWGRVRSQPVVVSVLVHLGHEYLDAAAKLDDVNATVNYGTLCKAVLKLVSTPGAIFDGPVGLARARSRLSRSSRQTRRPSR